MLQAPKLRTGAQPRAAQKCRRRQTLAAGFLQFQYADRTVPGGDHDAVGARTQYRAGGCARACATGCARQIFSAAASSVVIAPGTGL